MVGEGFGNDAGMTLVAYAVVFAVLLWIVVAYLHLIVKPIVEARAARKRRKG